ncbi:HPr family phosphocarrier protein [Thermocrispum municipale]|jgi:phosphocarrier protein|uniref:HPr family phosphocarrier protein n=1 Tax=Thermocrispum municipale TaxID=37926 RepID=UPI000418FD44|nr:HPr family phosphocarrier protein [Thermocrispum municipale]
MAGNTFQLEVTVGSRVGLHARPAAAVAGAAAEAAQRGVGIRIAKPGADPVDAASILGLMSLGAKHGDQVVLSTDADDAEQAEREVRQLAELVARDLDAPDAETAAKQEPAQP